MPDSTTIIAEVKTILEGITTPYNVMDHVRTSPLAVSDDSHLENLAEVTINGNLVIWWWTVLLRRFVATPLALKATRWSGELLVESYMVYSDTDIDGSGNGSTEIFRQQVEAAVNELNKTDNYTLAANIVTRGQFDAEFIGTQPGLLVPIGNKLCHAAQITLAELEIDTTE